MRKPESASIKRPSERVPTVKIDGATGEDWLLDDLFNTVFWSVNV